ncbi:putative pectate lyase 4 [Camellia lanceoleosa]|uniref:Pectate lyase 4 n=1 Tax=Camellia lanceoleosa TaxID=1840588 RepID=A0ACC0H0J6_9ERIC|nr:putative pectate lyase 4 [Camellia lanceoleosa]
MMMGQDHFMRVVVKTKGTTLGCFELSGTIHLSSYLNVSSYKTIDGRGHRIKLAGKCLRLKECEHVIICNMELNLGVAQACFLRAAFMDMDLYQWETMAMDLCLHTHQRCLEL